MVTQDCTETLITLSNRLKRPHKVLESTIQEHFIFFLKKPRQTDRERERVRGGEREHLGR